jgi:hypothetical protein
MAEPGQCVQSNAYGYGEAHVAATTLTIQPMNIDQTPLTNDNGSPCGPFVIHAQPTG